MTYRLLVGLMSVIMGAGLAATVAAGPIPNVQHGQPIRNI